MHSPPIVTKDSMQFEASISSVAWYFKRVYRLDEKKCSQVVTNLIEASRNCYARRALTARPTKSSRDKRDISRPIHYHAPRSPRQKKDRNRHALQLRQTRKIVIRQRNPATETSYSRSIIRARPCRLPTNNATRLTRVHVPVSTYLLLTRSLPYIPENKQGITARLARELGTWDS